MLPMPSPLRPTARKRAPITDDDLVGGLLTTGEVARLFRVDPKTVCRWADQGRLPAIRTPGGQRRVPAGFVHRHLSPP